MSAFNKDYHDLAPELIEVNEPSLLEEVFTSILFVVTLALSFCLLILLS